MASTSSEDTEHKPELIYSSEEDDESDDESDEMNPYNVVDTLQAYTNTRDIPKLTYFEKSLKRKFTYDDQTDPELQEFSDYDVINMCNWWRDHEISNLLGEKSLPTTRMNPGSLYNQTSSVVIHMIDRLLCPRNCYYDPGKCLFEDQHTYDYKELLRKDLHDKFNPEFRELFEKPEVNIVKLTREERNHPNTTKLCKDIGYTTELVYDEEGYLSVNFEAIQKKYWDYETPQFVLEQKKVFDVLLALIVSSSKTREIGHVKVLQMYQQSESGVNPPILASMYHGPDLEMEFNGGMIAVCDLENDEKRDNSKEVVVHKNCRNFKRADHWTFMHNEPSGSENTLDFVNCTSNKNEILEGPVSKPDFSILYPCNLEHCWKSCDCRFCKLSRKYECGNHKQHIKFNIKTCMLQQAAQCQEHMIDHPDNFKTGEDIEIRKNILFHNNRLLANGRQYCIRIVRLAGLKLSCMQCREDVREHFSKHLAVHLQCKLCLHELKSTGDECFWEKVCDICGKKYTSKRVRDYHKKIHKEEKLVCDICDSKFSGKFAYQRHLVEQHNISLDESCAENFKCELCGETLKYERNLIAHIETVHERKHLVRCTICGIEITKSSHLKRHLAEQHSILNVDRVLQKEEAKKFTCEHCTKVFNRQSHLDEHLKTHMDARERFKCDECSSTFTLISNLKRHKKEFHSKSPELYSCQLCEKNFAQKSNLDQHLKTHDENRKQYPCNFCEQVFYAKNNLDRHLKTHSEPERKYTCDKCGQEFKREDNLMTHESNFH